MAASGVDSGFDETSVVFSFSDVNVPVDSVPVSCAEVLIPVTVVGIIVPASDDVVPLPCTSVSVLTDTVPVPVCVLLGVVPVPPSVSAGCDISDTVLSVLIFTFVTVVDHKVDVSLNAEGVSIIKLYYNIHGSIKLIYKF